jgi:hypothetical protein
MATKYATMNITELNCTPYFKFWWQFVTLHTCMLLNDSQAEINIKYFSKCASKNSKYKVTKSGN